MNLKFLVTRSIYEEPNISQRIIAKKFAVSLGKINSIIKEAESDGYLKQDVKNSSYKITLKGKNFIEKYKVDGALILACGMGIRLAPLTYDTPKCFIKIKGERMIERQIEQLKSAGIDNITIMVGYLKEKFDYLIDKYGVKLIYNPEYKDKNTLSTFYHASEVLRNKNMYVCVSDVYMTENIYHRYECEPYYIGAYIEDLRNEWRYITNSKNEIKAVEVGGKNDYHLVGPCFLTKDFLSKFLPMIDDYYHRTSTDNYYWEDVLVNNFKALPTMYLYKLDEGIIFEFDNLSDIKKYDKENTEFGSEAITFVSKVFKIKDNEIENISCIKEGMTNHSYKFTYDGNTYIARVPGDGTDTYIDRKNEFEIFDKLKGKDIAEDIVYFDKNTGYMISKFFEDSRPVDITKHDELKKCMELYKKFHTSGVKVRGSCDIIDMIDEYLKIVKKKEVYIPYEDFDEVLKHAKDIEKIIVSAKRPVTICHGDPNPNNVLVTKVGFRLIDLEYGGMADPLSDIALFGAYVKFDTEKTYDLYKMYKEAKPLNTSHEPDIIPKNDELAKKLIICYMALAGLYNALWAVVRGALGNVEYGTFGMDGYRVFKNCYSKLIQS